MAVLYAPKLAHSLPALVEVVLELRADMAKDPVVDLAEAKAEVPSVVLAMVLANLSSASVKEHSISKK